MESIIKLRQESELVVTFIKKFQNENKYNAEFLDEYNAKFTAEFNKYLNSNKFSQETIDFFSDHN